MNYHQKYLKYKKKYKDLKKQLGGDLYDGINEYELFIVFPSNKVTEQYFENLYNNFYITKKNNYDDSFFGETNLEYIVNTEKKSGKILSFAIITIRFNQEKPILDNIVRLYGNKSNGYNPHKCQQENNNYTTFSQNTIMIRDILDKKYYQEGNFKDNLFKLFLTNESEGEYSPNYDIANYLNKKLNYCMNNNEMLKVYTFFDNLPQKYENLLNNKEISEKESDIETEIKIPTIKNAETPTVKEIKANTQLFNEWYEYALNKLCNIHKKCNIEKIGDNNITKRLEQIKINFESIKNKCEKQTEQFKEIYDSMVDIEKFIK